MYLGQRYRTWGQNARDKLPIRKCLNVSISPYYHFVRFSPYYHFVLFSSHYHFVFSPPYYHFLQLQFIKRLSISILKPSALIRFALQTFCYSYTLILLPSGILNQSYTEISASLRTIGVWQNSFYILYVCLSMPLLFLFLY